MLGKKMKLTESNLIRVKLVNEIPLYLITQTLEWTIIFFKFPTPLVDFSSVPILFNYDETELEEISCVCCLFNVFVHTC